MCIRDRVYTFVAAHGGKIGKSLCEEDKFDLVGEIERKAKERGVELVMATDCVAADAFANDAQKAVYPIDAIPEDRMGLDVGPETSRRYACLLYTSRCV